MSSITNIDSGDLITNSRADINNNFANLNADKMETSVLDTDTTLAADSDSKVATQKAVKAYVDAGGNVNASETTKGIVEIATVAEVAAGTTTGGTGATLVLTPEAFSQTTAPVVNVYEVGDSPATWTKPAGLKYVVVEVQAGGGGGGYDTSSTGASAGAGGGYSRKLIATATLGATETVTIGAAGAGATSGVAATAGGTSSLGSLVSCTGGAIGITSSSSATSGGSGSDGDLNISGANGTGAITDGNQGSTNNYGGKGGDSFLGKGGWYNPTTGASGYGAGGFGGGADSSNNGGAGTAGVVIVTEYYV